MAKSTFKENVVIITGASSGIGRQLAFQLAEQGAYLSLAARNKDRLGEVAAQCREQGARVLVVPTDVGIKDECEKLIAHTAAEYGRLDTLINNAAFSNAGYFHEFSDPTIFDSIMRVNYLGGVYCTYYALPHLKQTKGRIVGVSCLHGKVGCPHHTGYCGSKFAMAGFFDSLRLDLMELKEKVSITMIYAPPFVVTEMLERAIEGNGQPLGEVGRRFYTDKMMSPQVCARKILKAAARRKRHLVMSLQTKIALFFSLFAPGFMDQGIIRMGLAHKEKVEQLRGESNPGGNHGMHQGG